MKKLLSTIILTCILHIIHAQVTGIQFEQGLSWKQVLQKAIKENKFIFVDCYATWCGPCKAMDKNVYSNDSVGSAFNEKYIAIKVQCDSTKNDEAAIRRRYAEMKDIVKIYGLNVYPTYLFFSPAGVLLHKAIGYRNIKDFLKLIAEVPEPAKQYFTLVHQFDAGRMTYSEMPSLVKMAQELEDKTVISSVSRKYIKDYLDRLPDSVFFTKDGIQSVIDFSEGLSSKDRVFSLLKAAPQRVDTALKKKEIAKAIINKVLYAEEIEPFVKKAKEMSTPPNWDSIGKNIERKSWKGNIEPVLKGKMNWYESKEAWENYSASLIELCNYWRNMGKITVPAKNEILNKGAWYLFQKSNDPTKLTVALDWINLVINSMTDSGGHTNLFLDTKANLLYKLGRKEEAISLETRASAIDDKNGEIKTTLQKMHEGKPTW